MPLHLHPNKFYSLLAISLLLALLSCSTKKYKVKYAGFYTESPIRVSCAQLKSFASDRLYMTQAQADSLASEVLRLDLTEDYTVDDVDVRLKCIFMSTSKPYDLCVGLSLAAVNGKVYKLDDRCRKFLYRLTHDTYALTGKPQPFNP
jgi:hypothetical protein